MKEAPMIQKVHPTTSSKCDQIMRMKGKQKM